MLHVLSPKQARFVDEFGLDHNGTRAAVAAGYGAAGASVAAHRLLRNDKVRAEIEARQGVDARRLQTGRQEALEGLLEAVAAAREQANPMAMIAGWREIGKMLGFYAPERREFEVGAAAAGAAEQRRWEAMTDAELEAVVAGPG
jgi:phage terminase small subunit